MSISSADSPEHVSSQGHALASVDWLDDHFEAARPEYEALVRSAGIRRGWHVLDAGCGGGGFLPLLAAEVGPTGAITALDLAPENIQSVEQRIPGWHLDCPVMLQVSSLLELAMRDNSLDAVWCANTSQYLSDDSLKTALQEFQRVVRPGGLVILKEVNIGIWNFTPGDPGRVWRALQATREANVQIHGMLRTSELRRWMERAGLKEVTQRTILGERWAPLRPSERRFHGEIIQWLGQLAIESQISEDDRRYWISIQDLNSSQHPVNSPDFAEYDGQSLIVGRVS